MSRVFVFTCVYFQFNFKKFISFYETSIHILYILKWNIHFTCTVLMYVYLQKAYLISWYTIGWNLFCKTQMKRSWRDLNPGLRGTSEWNRWTIDFWCVVVWISKIQNSRFFCKKSVLTREAIKDGTFELKLSSVALGGIKTRILL